MSADLSLADDLSLPLEAVTSTIGILGVRGSGKTTTAAVLVEELVGANCQIVVIDPLDAWWGLRSSVAGDGEGLPVVVLGGDRGDLPLEPGMAAPLADLVVESGISVVLSLRHLSKTAQRRLVAEFAERLYHRKGEAQHRLPLHVVVDEADAFAPQAVRGDVARAMGAIDDLVRRGRSSGFGVTLITQRAAAINKDVLTQVEVLVCHRTVSPQDRKALEAWIDAHDTEGHKDAFMRSLASLAIGEAWIWSPGWLDLFARVTIRRRQTFDSSATPKVGQARAVPAKTAAVDLDAIRARLEASIERVKEDDPRELRRRIAELERQLAERPVERVVERVEVPVIGQEASAKIVVALTNIIAGTEGIQAVLKDAAALRPGMVEAMTPPTEERSPAPPADPLPFRPSAHAKPSRNRPAGDTQLRAGARRMLTVLGRFHPRRLSRQQLATLAGFAVKGGTYGTYLGDLKRAGLIDEDAAGLGLIDIGALELIDLRPSMESMTTQEILETWRRALRAGERKMLDELVAAYPHGYSRAELARLSDFEPSGGTFGTYLGVLRRNGLIEVDGGEVRASATLFLGADR